MAALVAPVYLCTTHIDTTLPSQITINLTMLPGKAGKCNLQAAHSNAEGVLRD